MHELHHVYTAAFVGIVLLGLAVLAHFKLRRFEANIVPNPKFGVATAFEVIVEAILNLMKEVMGEERAWKFFPLLGGLFIYIFANNVLGVVPGFAPATDNINTNAACSVIVFLYYNYQGIKTHGFFPYLKHFLGPVLWLGPLMLIVELIGHLVRPVSLSVRLFGNMTGDHLVLGIFSDLVPLVVPVIFMMLGIFISLIQAFVFCLLSMIYIALATETEHH